MLLIPEKNLLELKKILSVNKTVISELPLDLLIKKRRANAEQAKLVFRVMFSLLK